MTIGNFSFETETMLMSKYSLLSMPGMALVPWAHFYNPCHSTNLNSITSHETYMSPRPDFNCNYTENLALIFANSTNAVNGSVIKSGQFFPNMKTEKSFEKNCPK